METFEKRPGSNGRPGLARRRKGLHPDAIIPGLEQKPSLPHRRSRLRVAEAGITEDNQRSPLPDCGGRAHGQGTPYERSVDQDEIVEGIRQGKHAAPDRRRRKPDVAPTNLAVEACETAVFGHYEMVLPVNTADLEQTAFVRVRTGVLQRPMLAQWVDGDVDVGIFGVTDSLQ